MRMRQKLNGIASLALIGIVAVAVFMGCATANNTVTVGIVHDKLDSRAGSATGTTDLFGYSLGATASLQFEGTDMDAVTYCAVSGLVFGGTDLREVPATQATTRLPFSFCTEVDLSPDDDVTEQ